MKKFAVVVNDGRNSNAGYEEDLYEYNTLEEAVESAKLITKANLREDGVDEDEIKELLSEDSEAIDSVQDALWSFSDMEFEWWITVKEIKTPSKPKVYVLTEISSGEVRLEFDDQLVFLKLADAQKELAKRFREKLKELKPYGEITQQELDVNEYSIILEEDYEDSIYEGYIKELEVK